MIRFCFRSVTASTPNSESDGNDYGEPVVSPASLTATKGSVANGNKNDYYIEVSGIKPDEFDSDITVEYAGATVTMSVLDYAGKIIANSTNPAISPADVTLAKSLIVYNREAEACFGDKLTYVDAVAPDCTTAGNKAYYEDKNHNYYDVSTHAPLTAEQVVDPALGHDWGNWTQTTDPTCTEKGEETRECSRCHTTDKQDVDALGHKSDKGTVTKKATYTATGVKTYKCTVCGKVLKTETIAKLPKKANTLVAKGKTATVKFANLKKKNQTIAIKNALTVSNAKGSVTYAKASGNKKITVAKNGKITLAKGLKKGTYKLGIKVTAAGNTQYKAKTVTATVTIKVN